MHPVIGIDNKAEMLPDAVIFFFKNIVFKKKGRFLGFLNSLNVTLFLICE